MAKSDGQALLERVEAWIRSYVLFPDRVPDASLVCAAWIVNTWIYRVWSSCPVLAIQAATSGAAKSVLLECLSYLAYNGYVLQDPTPAYLYAKADAAQKGTGWITPMIDEADRVLARETAPLRGVLNPAYREGGTIGRRLPGSTGTIDYDVYLPVATAGIGDLYHTLRMRSIIIPLERAGTAKLKHMMGTGALQLYRPREARAQAAGLKTMIAGHVRTLGAEPFAMRETPWIAGREEELWSPLWSLLHVLEVDAATRKRFEMISNDLIGIKDQDATHYTNAQASEDEARDVTRGEQLVEDLARVLKDGERGIGSVEAVRRLRALADRPWRTFKGSGVTENNLAALVERFDLRPARLPRARGQVQTKGYRREAIQKALKLIQTNPAL